MSIYVVKPGDTLYDIGRAYGVSADKIARDNELTNPNRLVVGQTLVVDRNGMTGTTYTIQPGDSLYSIATGYGVTVQDIIKANPDVTSPALIYPGMTLKIPMKQKKTIEVNGYAYTNIDKEDLRKTLPYLTYLSIFSYDVEADGSFEPIEDEPLIKAARAAKVAPIMVITNKDFSSDIVKSVLTNEEAKQNLWDNVIRVMEEKNYYGLNIDFEYIYPANREDYNQFLRDTTAKLDALGYPVFTALAPKVSATQTGRLYEAHDYPVHGQYANRVIPMTYEWGYTYSEPMAVAPVDQVQEVLDYVVTAVPPSKVLMGIPNYGYNWILPFQRGRAATVVSNTEAVDIAAENNAAIEFDPRAQAPYFNYWTNEGIKHEVWFEDARSIRAKLGLVNKYNLAGVSYWTIANYFPQNWLILNDMFNVRKVL